MNARSTMQAKVAAYLAERRREGLKLRIEGQQLAWFARFADAGGETAARLYSLIGTCRLNGIDLYLYLRQVLRCIAGHPINRIE